MHGSSTIAGAHLRSMGLAGRQGRTIPSPWRIVLVIILVVLELCASVGFARAQGGKLHNSPPAAAAATAMVGRPQRPMRDESDIALACQIQANANYSYVLDAAHKLLVNFTAGAGYPQVWIRDTNTFIDVALDVVDHTRVRQLLLGFLALQGADGDIVDGYQISNNQTFKNTVETDQETSLVQAIGVYVERTGDASILREMVTPVHGGGPITVPAAIERAFGFLARNRTARGSSLLFGGTTIDWGDVQPEDNPGTVWDAKTHPAIDIYDNSMYVLALDAWVSLLGGASAPAAAPYAQLAATVRADIERVLWDAAAQKYRPHVYLSRGSPFSPSFNESALYYHGGTTVAGLASLLTRSQMSQALSTMRANVAASGANVTVGLTVWPPYPYGVWANPCCNNPFSYQNAGDWSWFGGRTVLALVNYGLIADAVKELDAMAARVVRFQDFNEWYNAAGQPSGSPRFHGAAGVLGFAVKQLQRWAASTLSAVDAAARERVCASVGDDEI